MVEGVAKFQRRMRSVAARVQAPLRAELEKIAADMVRQMQSIVARRDGVLAASIGYTFDRPPKGSIRVATVSGGGGKESLVVTIYAGGRTASGDAFYARFVEFGTKPHSIPVPGSDGPGVAHPGARAQPFFFPVFRANKKNVRAKIRIVLRRALRGV